MTSSSSDGGAPLTQGDVALGALGRLARDLAEPLLTVGLPELAALWTFDLFRFSCPRPPDMEDYPELSERLRGAFGAALHGQPQPVTATGYPRPHPRDVLFAPMPTSPGEEEHAKPVIIRGWIEGAWLLVELRVFGWAMGWRNEAAAAMLQALRNGVALRNGRRAQRIILEPAHVEHRRTSFIDQGPPKGHGRLRFRSPVAVRQRGLAQGEPRAILHSALRRVERMGRWQGCRLLAGQSWMDRVLDPVEFSVDGWREVRWDRFTRNQGPTAVPMHGFLGDIVLDGPLGELALLLAIAETCNIGGHAALGMGWFDWIAA